MFSALLADVLRPRASDLVAVAVPPGPEWPGLIAAVWEAGAGVLPLDHRLGPSEARALLRAGRPTAILQGEELVRLDDGVPVDPDVALVVATSGTTGGPRLAELTHGAIRAAVESSAEALGCGADDPWLCCLPLVHVGGLLVVFRSLLLGAPVAVHGRFDPGAIEAEREVAFVSLVPTMLARLLDSRCDLSRFRAVLVGGAALSAELAARAERAGVRVVTTYGLTESCGGVVHDGRPLRGTDVRVGEDGEILLRGPTVMRGYRLRPEETAAAIGDGWLRTRDAGALTEDGHLHVLGRLDDVIVTGGEKVWPGEVEEVLREHPKVADAAVTGREDPEWGECVVAVVVPADPLVPPELEELRELAGSRLARYKAPTILVIVDRLPRTPSGKLRRETLRRLWAGGGSGPLGQ